MKDSILKKIKELQDKAKNIKNKSISPEICTCESSLHKAIRTQEDADIFMKRLKDLHK